jgi:WD40 repeat protein/predicted Ser/Thr protein kinase
MSQPPLERVEKLFHQAASLPPDQRMTFLSAHCADDTVLRNAVEQLLRHDLGTGAADSFLENPAVRPTLDLGPKTSSNARAESAPAGIEAIPGYEILCELGRGGVGIVYLARQTALGRLVALKMLLIGTPLAPSDLARFRTEAEALAKLQHPNVVQIYDIGEHGGRPYFAMEYVAGPNLDKQQDGMPQPAQDAAQLVEQLARTMHTVHQHGVIHRDLKPANILLAPDREPAMTAARPGPVPGLRLQELTPKITDFGLAKKLDEKRGQTVTGTIMGTPSYMAPEQAQGQIEHVGPAADIYSLGAILYELLTGRPPFLGASLLETLEQVRTQPPVSPNRLQPRLPRDLTTICLKCLEKDPRQRYATAVELADDLRRFQVGEPVRARPVSVLVRGARWCRRRPVVAGLLAMCAALLLALAVTGLLYHKRVAYELAQTAAAAETNRRMLVEFAVANGMQDQEEDESFTALLWFTEALRLDTGHPAEEADHRLRIGTLVSTFPDLRQLLLLPGPVPAAGFSRDGCRLATAGAKGARVWDLARGTAAGPELPTGARVGYAALASRETWLATASADYKIRVWDWSTGQPLGGPWAHTQEVRQLAFHPETPVLIAPLADGQIQRWDLSSGMALGQLLDRAPRFSTITGDGRWAFAVAADGHGHIWNTQTGKEKTSPFPIDQTVTVAAISADGKQLACASGRTVRTWTLATPKRLGMSLHHPSDVTRMALSPDGQRLLTGTRDYRVWVWQVESGRLQIAPWRHDGEITQLRFSPDGRLALSAGTDNRALVRKADSGQALTPWLTHHGSVTLAMFAPDSRGAVTIAQDGRARLWDLGPSLDAVAELVREPRKHVEAVKDKRVYNRDKSRVLVPGTDAATLVIQDPSTQAQVGSPLHHASAILHAEFDPAGRRAVTASDDNTARIWDADTGRALLPPLLHRGSVRYAAFSPDGRWLITASEDRTAQVWLAATGRRLTAPLRHPLPVVRAEFSSDGRQAITVTEDGIRRTWNLTPDDRPLHTLILLAQVLSGSRIDSERGLLPLDSEELGRAWRDLQEEQRATPSRTQGD